jgi:hypothetical protein
MSRQTRVLVFPHIPLQTLEAYNLKKTKLLLNKSRNLPKSLSQCMAACEPNITNDVKMKATGCLKGGKNRMYV